MPESSVDSAITRLSSRAGMSVEVNANGSLRRFDSADVMLNLFLGNELEGGPTNLYLRDLSHVGRWTPLLGPRSATRVRHGSARNMLTGSGRWNGIDYSIALVLAQDEAAWFWHVTLENHGEVRRVLDLCYAQDLALAPYGAVRLNEYYVSQYVDHAPLRHPQRGWVVASRQNQAATGRNPWCVIGSLRQGVSFATDALQLHGLATRAGTAPAALTTGLPGRRLQHEHSLVAIQDEPLQLEPNARLSSGFFGRYVAHHPLASSPADLDHVAVALALPEATPVAVEPRDSHASAAATLFTTAPLLAALDLDAATLRSQYPAPWRHEERDQDGALLSFFHGEDRHVVLRGKELRVQRPHGHLLRTGQHTTADETALTSTVWMAGVFHSMLTQGHVSINRFLSTVHGYLGLFRSHGQRVFVEVDGAWQLLDVPSAFEMTPRACRWIYHHAGGEIEVLSEALDDPQQLALSLAVRSGPATRFLISHHVALDGDDGSAPGSARFWRDGAAVAVGPQPGSELARRFPQGRFEIAPAPGTRFEQVAGDDLLFLDGQSRGQPYICIVTGAASTAGLQIRGHLIEEHSAAATRVPAADRLIPPLRIVPQPGSTLGAAVSRIADIIPWYTHNALVHYLSPRGLEQYSGGGWGTRDVCQGPVELLLALGCVEPVRDLLLRVMRAQNADGDWPQWFMFFERERHIRAGDSHGDIVFWPLLALAQYLIASADHTLLEERVPFFAADGAADTSATVWQHVEQALAVIERRVIRGTSLAAYGHGDWNDALQPADPAMREHLCSAWTVTLHHQTLVTLAQALRTVGRDAVAVRLEQAAAAVQRDFERLLLVDGVLAGYAAFEGEAAPRYLLHPSDKLTGVRYSSLAMIHAILEDMLTPQQARQHLDLIKSHLSGPDGVRLFDRPLSYHGGPQRLFQRAESAAFFGREIGLMYMHAHLRYAQALAHVGDAAGFFQALCQANPIGIRAVVPTATLRQANCYYSSSDAAFVDRQQASAEYQRVTQGTIALDGGWRVYSSGAGIALALIMRRFLGLTLEATVLSIDPVMPAQLNGLRLHTRLFEQPIELLYRVRSVGVGVESVELNQHPLPLQRAANPYRLGAARIDAAAVRERLQRGGNVMVIEIA